MTFKQFAVTYTLCVGQGLYCLWLAKEIVTTELTIRVLISAILIWTCIVWNEDARRRRCRLHQIFRSEMMYLRKILQDLIPLDLDEPAHFREQEWELHSQEISPYNTGRILHTNWCQVRRAVVLQLDISLHCREIKTWLINNYGLLRGKSSLSSTDYIKMYCDDPENITPASWKAKWSHFGISSGTQTMMGDECSLIALVHILLCRIKVITNTGTITLPHFGTPSRVIHLACYYVSNIYMHYRSTRLLIAGVAQHRANGGAAQASDSDTIVIDEAADAHAPHAPNNSGDVQEEAEGGAPPARENSGLLAGENTAAPPPVSQVQAHADNAHAVPSGSFPGLKHVLQIRLQTLERLKEDNQYTQLDYEDLPRYEDELCRFFGDMPDISVEEVISRDPYRFLGKPARHYFRVNRRSPKQYFNGTIIWFDSRKREYHVKFTDNDVVAFPEEHVSILMQTYEESNRRAAVPPPPQGQHIQDPEHVLFKALRAQIGSFDDNLRHGGGLKFVADRFRDGSLFDIRDFTWYPLCLHLTPSSPSEIA
jgi:hypothetical protein